MTGSVPPAPPAPPAPGQRHRHLDGGQRRPCVPLAGGHHGVDGVVVGRGVLGLEAAPDQRAQALGAEGPQPPQGGAAQQGRVHLEEGVLGGGPDEHHQPVLDGRQEHVLLGLVEAVDLVDEEHGALAVLAQPPLGLGQRLAHVLDAGRGGREGDQVLGRGGRQQTGQGGLAGAGRPPQDGGAHPVGSRPGCAAGPRARPGAPGPPSRRRCGAGAGRPAEPGAPGCGGRRRRRGSRGRG